MKEILVIQEGDTIIGVASTVEKSFDMIREYYGDKSEIRNIRDIRDSGLEFECEVYTVDSNCVYYVTVHYFTIDEV